MGIMSTTTQPAKPKRRWYQFSLKTLMVVMTVFVLVLALWRQEPHLVQRRAAAQLEANGANITWVGIPPFQNVVQVTLTASHRRRGKRPQVAISNDIALIRHFTSLRTLSLWGVPVSDSDMVNLSRLNQLETLDLAHTNVTGDGLRQLSNLPSLTRLTTSGRCRSDIVLKRVSQISSLEDLEVREHGILESEFVHLRNLPNLKLLYLKHHRITDVGIDQLGSLTTLETLYISRNSSVVTDETLAKLKKAMPNCKIDRLPWPGGHGEK